MFKKALTLCVLYFCVNSICSAGSLYFAPALTYHDEFVHSQSYRGINAELHMGYGAWFRDYLIVAAEIFYGMKPFEISSSNNTNADGQKLQMGDSYGISVVPEFPLDDSFMGYLRLGYVKTDFRYVNMRQSAYQVGAGVEILWCDPWSIRIEYDYVPYSEVPGFGTINSNDVSVALVYRLDSIFKGPDL